MTNQKEKNKVVCALKFVKDIIFVRLINWMYI